MLEGLVSARCWVLRDRMRAFGFVTFPLDLPLFPAVCWLRGGYRPYFENYTVDASICNMTFGLCCVDDLKDH